MLNHKQLGEGTTRILKLVDRYSRQDRKSYDQLLEGAMAVFSHAERSFVEKRCDTFLAWLFEHFSSKLQKNPEYDHCYMNTFSHSIAFPFQSKTVVSFFIEVRNQPISLDSVKQEIEKELPGVSFINDSFIEIANQRDHTSKVHLEIYKEEALTESEIMTLKAQLSQKLERVISDTKDSLVMPSNRELLMKSFRWIMQDFKREDLPQVFIDFSKKTVNTIEFSVLICFIDLLHNQLIVNQLDHPNIHIDGTSSYCEKGLKKEGAVLTVDIPLNQPMSVIEARKSCFLLIESLIGPFRDVNGGLLEKIESHFTQFSSLLDAPRRDLRAFFYGITPQEKQATTPIPLLIKIFKVLDSQKNSQREYSYSVTEEKNFICITTKISHPRFEREYRRFLLKHFKDVLIIPTYLNAVTMICCALENMNTDQAERLKNLTFSFYSKWKEKREIKQVLRLGCTCQFNSFDPRIGIQEEPSHLLKMLFEGLMRIGPDGTPQMAIAERIDVSNSGKCYHFYLRESYWSNGTPLTAYDFAYSWEMSLQHFLSPLSYLFYPIENAQSVKEGQLPSKALGIQVIHHNLLEVRLQYPTPYFLELCAHSSFSPIHSVEDSKNPSWPHAKGKDYICNGPFKLDSSSHKEIVLSKNLHFWNVEKVHLEKVCIVNTSETDATHLFRNKELDLLLYPFCKRQDLGALAGKSLHKKQGVIETRYLGFNCLKGPFSNHKLRQAFSFALDRNRLAQAIAKEAYPHYTPYSPKFTTLKITKYEEENLSHAKRLFSQALLNTEVYLEEIKQQKIYATPITKTIVEEMCIQLNQAFGINLSPQIVDFSELFSLIRQKTIYLYLYGWVNRVQDISYFLDTFSSPNHIINYPCWENSQIHSLTDRIRASSSLESSRELQHEAEKILHREKPIIPLLNIPIYSAIPSNIEDILITDSQHFDLSFAYKI